MTHLVLTEELPVGARLARDVLTGRADQAPLLRAGVELTDSYRHALRRAGIRRVYVEDVDGDGIRVQPPLSEAVRLEATNALAAAFSDVPQALTTGRTIPATTVKSLEQIIRMILNDIAFADTATLALGSLAAADAYTFAHSIDVAVLGLLLAERLFKQHGRIDHHGKRTFGRVDEALRRVGIGLILHDIGKLAVPLDILRKAGPLDQRELAVLRGHPLAGVELLSGGQVSAHAQAVVRSHHERWDGGGYPDGRVGADIPQFARIASVADVYSALTTDRTYRDAMSPRAAIKIIRDGCGSAFDPEVLSIFNSLVAPYPPGSEITLADGSLAIVVSVPFDKIDLPLVRLVRGPDGKPVAHQTVALRDNPELAPS